MVVEMGAGIGDKVEGTVTCWDESTSIVRARSLSGSDLGIPVIRLSSSGLRGFGADDDARDICWTRYITASSS